MFAGALVTPVYQCLFLAGIISAAYGSWWMVLLWFFLLLGSAGLSCFVRPFRYFWALFLVGGPFVLAFVAAFGGCVFYSSLSWGGFWFGRMYWCLALTLSSFLVCFIFGLFYCRLDCFRVMVYCVVCSLGFGWLLVVGVVLLWGRVLVWVCAFGCWSLSSVLWVAVFGGFCWLVGGWS